MNRGLTAACAAGLALLGGAAPAGGGVTAHKLRHTFASILFVRGEDPPYVMGQLGHTDPGFTLRVYAHAMRRDAGDLERLNALVNGADWAAMGRNRPETPSNTPSPCNLQEAEGPSRGGSSEDGRGGFRTCDLSRVKREEGNDGQSPEQGRLF